MVVAFAARLIASRLPFTDDEASTLLAAQQIARTGAPVLPSGVLYLHGAVISYLLAPFAWFGWLDIGHLQHLRLLNVVIGTMVAPVAWLVGRKASGSTVTGLLAALFVAIEPASVLWGSYLRMYALLAVAAGVFALCFLEAVREPRGEAYRRALILMVVALWVAVFSQIAGALLWPAAVLAAFALFGRELVGARRGLTIALAACLPAVIVYVALGRVFSAGGTASAGSRTEPASIGFPGDHLLDPSRMFSPNMRAFKAIFLGNPFGEVLPVLVVALAAVVAGVWVIAGSAQGDRRNAAGALLSLAWVPVLLVTALVESAGERYHLTSIVALMTLAAWGIRTIFHAGISARTSGGLVRAGLAAGMTAMLLGHDMAIVRDLKSWAPSNSGGQLEALAAIAPQVDDETLVIASFPPTISYHVLGDRPGIRFFNVTGQYNLPAPDGSPRDYWLGRPMITTRGELCRALVDSPGAFVLFMQSTLMGKSGSGGIGTSGTDLIAAVQGASEPFHADERVQVYRTLPVNQWTEEAHSICGPMADRTAGDKSNTDGGRSRQNEGAAPGAGRNNRPHRQATPSP